jgi:CBS domain-containing protein
MKVKELMMMTPYACHPESNLGAATELMWRGNCGFLPVVDGTGRVAGVLTDRDLCIALGTRNSFAGEVKVSEVMQKKLFTCSPDDEVHVAMQIMQEGGVRRLPVVTNEGKLAGVLSLHDVLLKAEPTHLGSVPELSSDEVLRTYRAIIHKDLPMKAKKAAG